MNALRADGGGPNGLMLALKSMISLGSMPMLRAEASMLPP
jgi:hypothetical protein